MGFCGKCGFRLDDGFAFCPRCGASTRVSGEVKERKTSRSVSRSEAKPKTESKLEPEAQAKSRSEPTFPSKPQQPGKPGALNDDSLSSIADEVIEGVDKLASRIGNLAEGVGNLAKRSSEGEAEQDEEIPAEQADSIYEPDPVPSDGRAKRCPACGEMVSVHETICPTCGFEVRDVADGSIALLSKKLEIIESKRPEKRRKDKKSEISTTDERKISLIRNWPMPNSREDLIEFMAMASGNCIPPAKIGSDRVASEDALAEAWRSKFDQAYVKAQRLFGATEDFEQFKALKEEVRRNALQARIRPWLPLIIGIAAYLFVFLFLVPLAFKAM